MPGISSVKLNTFTRCRDKATEFALGLIGTKKNPNPTIKSEKLNHTIEWIGKNLSSAENRLILGASALLSQPFIDAANKDVDKDTRKISICRTVAKIIAGTLTGYTIRKLCIKSIDAFTKLPEQIKPNMKFKKMRRALTPNGVKSVTDELVQYKNAFGTILGLVVMTFTNFLIDAPLTKYLTNLFAKIGGVNNERNK